MKSNNNSGIGDKLRLSKNVAPYVFISPFFILFLIFGLFPILYSFFLSFNSWDGIGQMSFVGLDNYAYILTDDWFWDSVKSTLIIFALTTIPQHVFALTLAFILNSTYVKLKDFFRTSYFLPYITSAVAIAIIFDVLLGHRSGLLNALLIWANQLPPVEFLFQTFNFDLPARWLGEPRLIRFSIAGLLTWRFTGWNMLIYFAGLQTIPKSLYEAARVDGASIRQVFTKITLPLLKPVIFFGVTMSIIGNLQLFEEPFVLVGADGGTGRAGMTTAMYLFRTGFHWRQFGEGSAMAYVLCVFIIILSLVNKKLFSGGGLNELQQ
ncbi:sugar ABC transporter permease [Halanaerobiaceae bacterium Z-7014]|uniref:Sugar ABC transporter permease n=1 Tax=Halonatronomonas betaini TaxID=2778430 RepID=A0A931ANW9_9FIRM|nr:sugar ABC transporter permease [Halonatronomonas betaini]MBF8436263.1 sugar ABC transporter permease [Halonatronomonas betaini]